MVQTHEKGKGYVRNFCRIGGSGHMGSPSGLCAAQVRHLNLTQKCLPGRRPGINQRAQRDPRHVYETLISAGRPPLVCGQDTYYANSVAVVIRKSKIVIRRIELTR